ncbi:hypothetical protein MYSTI_07108 [Myxococcus stipitatus DSM 14675]|uniref:DUF3943 domain-containing protein n=1 Tax=Myxococcus stipitatus (strain DSM 14675 / JCM 12634 / Mx s8) TaxID=1278073 RepID=L7UKD8_MYXSD|nr:DUF3943 domain-containing protein [Myxococcus stipitatus]AGC48380.1 hypothetical protein MYSTI_07108 [Myxococcus stipitatus DSM 14675]
MLRWGGPLLMLWFALATSPARAEEQDFPADAPVEERDTPTRHPWLALAEVTAINLVVWTYDVSIGNKEWARISVDSWKKNLETGFVWDGDGFSTNQFAHPYHGSLYYTAARDNGIPYPGAFAFSLLGSAQWELFAETEPPSFNDLINTSLGGTAMGEALYRLSSVVLDTETSGRERAVREVAAGVLSPIRGINRLLRGDTFRIEPTPDEWKRHDVMTWASTGYLTLGDGELLKGGKDQFFAQVSLRYGDAYRDPIRRPFDAFEGHIQFTTRESSLVSHARLTGLLAVSTLVSTPKDELRVGLFQRLNYVDTLAYEVGGQSFDVGMMYLRQFSPTARLKTYFALEAGILSGVSSEHSGEGNRDYDYGSGVGAELRVTYAFDGWDVLTLEGGTSHIAVLDGSGGSHKVHTGQLMMDVPVSGRFGLGTEMNYFQRNSRFVGYSSVRKSTYELRFFISVH